MKSRTSSLIAAGLIALSFPVPSTAKVSTSVILCFEPNDDFLSENIEENLAYLVQKSHGLGTVAAIFVLSVAESDVESREYSSSRARGLLTYLARHGFKTELNDNRRVEAPASDMGCNHRQVAVEVEALFPHDGYQ
jgi:hypothetical protein